MTKAELIFYEMTDREIFSRAKTVYEKLGMSEKGLLSVMRPTMGAVTILSVDLTNKIRDAVSMQYDDFLADDYIERAKKIQNEMKEKREESIKEQKVSNSYIDKFNKEVQDSDNDFERECTKEIVRLIKLLPDKSAKKLIKKYLNKLGEAQLRRLLDVRFCDIMAHNPYYAKERLWETFRAEEVLNEVLEEEKCFTIKDLAINGKDIMELGVKEGPDVGKWLNYALEEVINDKLDNDKEDILNNIDAKLYTEREEGNDEEMP